MSKNSESSVLFLELYKSIKEIGLKGVTTILQNNRSKGVTISNEDFDFVVKMVSTNYYVPVEEIFSGKNKSVKKRLALGFICYLLNNVFGYTFRDMEQKLKKDKATLSRNNKFICDELKKAKMSHYQDAKALFLIKIETYKNNKKVKDGE